jgi:hypothetical protein
LVLLILLSAIAWPACADETGASSTVTVAQLEQVLAAGHNERDKKLAQQISKLELTERLSAADLERLERSLPGPNARAALISVADASAFLAPSMSESPGLDLPDRPTQLKMLARAIEYVARMRPKLPDFSAQRTTTHFEVTTPQRVLHEHQIFQFFQTKEAKLALRELGPVAATQSTGVRLFLMGTWAGTVTYRDGSEVESAPEGSGGTRSPQLGLTTVGEFGPALSVVVGDASRSEIKWERWEKGEAGPLAVFRYSVPKDVSRFEVSTRRGDLPGPFARAEFPAYHGEITIDPTDGTVYRITMEANPSETDTAKVLVEYGPVSIGGKTYVCPLRGVAISSFPERTSSEAAINPGVPRDEYLNHIVFTDYHVFRSESRIILDGNAGP